MSKITVKDGTGAKAVKLLKHGQLISYPGFPHGMPATEAATLFIVVIFFA